MINVKYVGYTLNINNNNKDTTTTGCRGCIVYLVISPVRYYCVSRFIKLLKYYIVR